MLLRSGWSGSLVTGQIRRLRDLVQKTFASRTYPLNMRLPFFGVPVTVFVWLGAVRELFWVVIRQKAGLFWVPGAI